MADLAENITVPESAKRYRRAPLTPGKLQRLGVESNNAYHPLQFSIRSEELNKRTMLAIITS
jgi:hypothetical protein